MTHTPQAPLAKIRGLSVTFDSTTAVRDVSFDLAHGKCVALVGQSGSGKSVTARSLLGLVGRGSKVTADTLDLGGRDLLTLSEREWRDVRGNEVGFVLQDALVSLDPLARVGSQVTEAITAHTRLRRTERVERALKLLEEAGVPDAALRARQYPHELSGGLRQRALIASAVAASPRVLIADEPTTALDVTVQAQILALLGRLQTEGTGLLLVSHDLAVVSQLADEILVLRNGEVVEQGTKDEVLGAPRAEYTKSLLAAVPSSAKRSEFFVGGQREPAPTPDTAQPPVLQALHLHKRYGRPGGGYTTALNDVSFALNRGTTLGIVGESGSGKSTAANTVLGFITPDSGEVLLDGKAWSSIREKERRPLRHRIQAISQDPLGSFDPRASVQEILTEALAAVGVPRTEQAEHAVQLLSQVGLGSEQLRRNPLELSGGQRQRVAISRALATNPEVIVCDEAVSALDVSVQAQVLELLADLQEQLGVSLLFISHDLGVIRSIADEAIVMRGGQIVEAGRTEQVFTAPQHAYTRELIAAIPRLKLGNRDLHTSPLPTPQP